MIHEIELTGYDVSYLGEGTLTLGTWESHGIEKLHITADSDWDGLTILATFRIGSTSVRMLMDGDGIISVPPEATSESGSGVIVFSGTDGEMLRVSRNLKYKVLDHDPIDGEDSKPTPSELEQLVNRVNGVQAAAEQAAKQANASCSAASESANNAAAYLNQAAISASRGQAAADSAELSLSEARKSAQEAENSAAAASSSEQIASSSASKAAIGATAAASSASAAESSKTRAEACAAEAEESKLAAANSASAASDSASEASDSKTAAADSAAAASGSAAAAAESAAEAVSKAAEALESEKNAAADAVSAKKYAESINPGNFYTKEQADVRYVQDSALAASILSLIYPVGSIYISTANVSPATFIGGTWQQVKDVFLLAAGNKFTAGATGGEEVHTLTIAEIPGHRHGVGSHGQYDNIGASGGQIGAEFLGSNDYGLYFTDWQGGGQSHNNMPPYLTVYMWQRMA